LFAISLFLDFLVVLFISNYSDIILTPINLNSSALTWSHFLVRIPKNLSAALLALDVGILLVVVAMGFIDLKLE